MPDDYVKHAISNDALDTLGTIITESEKRDAIHLAVYPAEAGHYLIAGTHVKLVDNMAVPATEGEGVGIVDPFLVDDVQPGEWFWLVVYPRQITSLRHVWEHEAFPPSGETETKDIDANQLDKTASELWLRKFVADNDLPDFDTVVAAATGADLPPVVEEYYDPVSYQNEGDYIIFYGIDAHCTVDEVFWHHMEIYTGLKLGSEVNYFACSC